MKKTGNKTPLPMLAALLMAAILTPSISRARELVKVWETAPVMDKPESAAWDQTTGYIYISNIGGDYLQHDDNGYISLIREDGSVADTKWLAQGLDNPQGLALVGNKLYVADFTRIVVIDIKTATIEKNLPAEGAQFLNDAAEDANGDVYFSGIKTNRIYKVTGDNTEIWMESAALNAPNGLLCAKESILALSYSSGSLLAIDKQTKAITKLCDGIADADGLTSDGEGGYFATASWQGKVYHIDAEGCKTLILDLGPDKTVAADICYIPEKELLVIPTLGKTVLGYRWE